MKALLLFCFNYSTTSIYLREEPSLRSWIKLNRRKRQKLRSLVEAHLNSSPNRGQNGAQVQWFFRRFQGCDLYPNLNPHGASSCDFPSIQERKLHLKPSENDFKLAQEIIIKKKFKIFDSGRVVVMQRENIIAMIEFDELDKLPAREIEDYQCLSHFAYQSKQISKRSIINSSSSWGGSKWKVGWRKSMKPGKSITRYDTNYYDQHCRRKKQRIQYRQFLIKSKIASKILSNMFKNMHTLAFEENQDFIIQNSLPSFSSIDPQHQSSTEEFNIGPSLSFTSDGYFDLPHVEDLPGHRFSIFIPQNKLDGTLFDERSHQRTESTHPTSNTRVAVGSLLVFPNYEFAINISKPNHIVKVILFHPNKFTHCITPTNSTKLDTATRLEISSQINSKLWGNSSASFSNPAYHYHHVENDHPDLDLDLNPDSNIDQKHDEYLLGLSQLLYTSP